MPRVKILTPCFVPGAQPGDMVPATVGSELDVSDVVAARLINAACARNVNPADLDANPDFTVAEKRSLKGVVSGDGIFTMATLTADSTDNAGVFFLVSDEHCGTLYRSNGTRHAEAQPRKV